MVRVFWSFSKNMCFLNFSKFDRYIPNPRYFLTLGKKLNYGKNMENIPSDNPGLDFDTDNDNR